MLVNLDQVLQPALDGGYAVACFNVFGCEDALAVVETAEARGASVILSINLDMVGTGSKGITIVNSIAYKGLYDDMVKINSENNYMPEIKQRGEACNSDHCPFYNMGVKSIFIYTMGDEHLDYHTVSDTSDDFPFTAYEGLFRLLTDYVSAL